jgi:sugar phosphate isomerase/epimerase
MTARSPIDPDGDRSWTGSPDAALHDGASCMNRRRFARVAGLLGAFAAGWGPALDLAVAAPIQRSGASRLRLGLAAYSFRDWFVDSSHRTGPPRGPLERHMDLFRFLDFCAEHGCDGAELTSYYFPADADHAFMARVRRHAFVRGLSISGTAVGNTFTHEPGSLRDEQLGLVRRWIRHASILGAPHIRVFAGDRQPGQSHEQAKERCIESLRQCAAWAGEQGIVLGLENHGGIVARSEDLVDIVERVQSPWVGINLDTGNFHTPDPYADLERCAPYAVNVQFKGMVRPQGQALQEADWDRTFALLRAARYQGYVVLEYEVEADPWVEVPRWLERMKRWMG